MPTKEDTRRVNTFKVRCLILFYAAAGGQAELAAAEPPDPVKILEAFAARQDRLLNHHIRFVVQHESQTSRQFTPSIYIRTVFQGKARLDIDRQVGSRRQLQRLVLAPPLRKSCNTSGGENNFIGSIRELDPDDYLSMLNHSSLETWLFGVAWGDTAHVWQLMAEFPEQVSASETVVDGARRIRLSAKLPSGNYGLEVEPDRQYRLRRFSFEKLHSEGHFSPVGGDMEQSLPEGVDHLEEFVRGTIEFDGFIESHGLWFPSSGRYVNRYHSTRLDEPVEAVFRVQVQKFEMLLEPPAPDTFEMDWPPHTQVQDRTPRDGFPEPMFFADINGQLKRLEKLAVGDPVPRIEGNTWFEESSTADLADLEEKYVFIYNWATWRKPCVVELPKFEEVFEEFRDVPDVIIMGINAYDEDAKLARFMQEKGLTFPQLLGEDAQVAMNLLGFTGAGEGILMGPDGRVIGLYPVPDGLREILAQLPRH